MNICFKYYCSFNLSRFVLKGSTCLVYRMLLLIRFDGLFTWDYLVWFQDDPFLKCLLMFTWDLVVLFLKVLSLLVLSAVEFDLHG